MDFFLIDRSLVLKQLSQIQSALDFNLRVGAAFGDIKRILIYALGRKF